MPSFVDSILIFLEAIWFSFNELYTRDYFLTVLMTASILLFPSGENRNS